MKNRFFTVLVLRPSGPRMRKFRLSYAFAAAGTLLGVMLLAAGLLAPSLLFRVRSQTETLSRLESENRVLRQERGDFEGALAQVSERLSAYEAQAGRLAQELGVKDLPTGDPAVGGAALEVPAQDRNWFDGELRGLQSRTENLDQSFGQIDNAFQVRVARLAATPSTMPIEGWFSHGYGWRKDPWTGKRQFHRGIDIVAHANTEIRAPGDGVVSRSGRYSDLGRSIDIAHGYGFVTRYAHMNKILVKPGQRIQRGEVIGLVGSTGRSTGAHLHYEIFRDGRRVNPWKYLGRD